LIGCSAARGGPIDFVERRLTVKRAGLWAIALGVVVSMGAEQGYAGEKEEKCTVATLKGQYLFAESGMLLPPAVPSPLPTNGAGFHIFNGDGTGTDFVTISVNGIDQHVPSPVAITYTLNPDCTGTLSVQNGPNHDIFVAVDGSSVTSINTDPGVAASGGTQPRVRLER
jgi:hypothetical protein